MKSISTLILSSILFSSSLFASPDKELSLARQNQRMEFSSLIDGFMNEENQNKKRINLSGKQRMLTQRMSKLVLLIESNINKKSNQDKLAQYAMVYDKTLKGFKNGDEELGCIPLKIKSIQEQITIIEKAWTPFYEHLQKIINNQDNDQTSLAYIIANNEELLSLSNELVKRFENENKSQNYLDKAMLSIINIAGRQRMLTQKMTKEKLLIIKGKTEYQPKLEESIRLFDTSLQALIVGDSKQMIVKPTNEEIKTQLTKVSNIWQELKPLYEKGKLQTKEMALIIQKNPILLDEMHKMVNMAETTTEY
ncbi:MAG: hypothetical protein KU29_10295 [Sulfurovum sp. FS06-10]|nr:MAG: hypothetical protein KU29_10295 [Sulfurovum sp. FS06-10]